MNTVLIFIALITFFFLGKFLGFRKGQSATIARPDVNDGELESSVRKQMNLLSVVGGASVSPRRPDESESDYFKRYGNSLNSPKSTNFRDGEGSAQKMAVLHGLAKIENSLIDRVRKEVFNEKDLVDVDYLGSSGLRFVKYHKHKQVGNDIVGDHEGKRTILFIAPKSNYYSIVANALQVSVHRERFDGPEDLCELIVRGCEQAQLFVLDAAEGSSK